MQSVSEKFATLSEPPSAKTPPKHSAKPAFLRFGSAVLLLSIAFTKPLYDLVRFAYSSDTFSHILLIPFVCVWLIWLKRDALNRPSLRVEPLAIGLCFVLALVALGAFWFAGQTIAPQNRLCLSMAAYLLCVMGAGFALLGTERMKALAFPFFFSIFIVPFPTHFTNWIEIFFQHTSAEAAAMLINVSSLPLVRDGLLFHLPGLTLQVAQECSGIRSTLVLFITSLLAGYLFLHSPWKRAFLTAFVIPLAILRNGLRIFTLAYLTVEIDPDVIHSPLHHRGGPIFFALSLIPFFLLLLLLRKYDSKKRNVRRPG